MMKIQEAPSFVFNNLATYFQSRGLLFAILHIVDSPERNPKGCKESSRWSESAETTGNGIFNWVAPRRGARTFDVAVFWVVT
jgi:hypothetical protein